MTTMVKLAELNEIEQAEGVRRLVAFFESTKQAQTMIDSMEDKENMDKLVQLAEKDPPSVLPAGMLGLT